MSFWWRPRVRSTVQVLVQGALLLALVVFVGVGTTLAMGVGR